MKKGYIYFITNWTGDVLYTGVTSDLIRRVWQHKNKSFDGFSCKYQATKLVYYEQYDEMTQALKREKQIKNWRRDKKNMLVNDMNPEWSDLSEGWYEDPSASLGMTGRGRS